MRCDCGDIIGFDVCEVGPNAVRLRRMGGDFSLTVKSSGTMIRAESEISISEDQFDDLWAATEGRRILKDRYFIPYGYLKIEVDVFKGKLKGLVIAEVEFESVAAALVFQKLEWMDIEVTENLQFNNRNLLAAESFEEVLTYL